MSEDRKTTRNRSSASAELLLARTIEHLSILLTRLVENLDTKGAHSSVVKESVRVSQAIATVTAEQRARDKAAAKERSTLDPAHVMEWLRRQPDEVKLHIVREISSSLDHESSVLS